MRVLLQHRSHYGYAGPTTLGTHTVRLRPAPQTAAEVASYTLEVAQDGRVRWQQDPYGNHIARIDFGDEATVDALDVLVEMALSIQPVNPFDFLVDSDAEAFPFAYAPELRAELAPFLDTDAPCVAGGPLLSAFLGTLPTHGPTIDSVVAINRQVQRALQYVVRLEPGVWTPEETLAAGRGSCRDSAVLTMAALRSRGFAARFVSGYLLQFRDEGMLPDEPRGLDRDVADLHAWCEVYLPGAGWIGLDATSGLLCGEGHVPLACAAAPSLAAPIEGTASRPADEVSFTLTVQRLGHETGPTTPYAEETWTELLAAAAVADARLVDAGFELTCGGEPTFNARDGSDLPEWNEAALGPAKWARGTALAGALLDRWMPGGLILHRQGKWYPGESLPRWALELLARVDGTRLAGPAIGRPGPDGARCADADAAARDLAAALADHLGFAPHLMPAYEDPWHALREEARLPVEVDPLQADLTDSEARRRLARLLDRGLGAPVGYVLPLDRRGGDPADASSAPVFVSERWTFRRERLYLLPGDSPIGLRLPLDALRPAPPGPEPAEPPGPRDPRRPKPRPAAPSRPVRTALCVEPRDGRVHVFLPPTDGAEHFLALLAAVDACAAGLAEGVVVLEGYPPPKDGVLRGFSVTPDPGVVEVNLPPADSTAAYAELVLGTFDAALAVGLHAEKYLLDGRMAGSGGGNHLTLGGPTPARSPWVLRPDLLASLITFCQHHPSMAYLFTGLFVGPTSQAPRLDEARHDALAEMEIALAEAFTWPKDAESPPTWLGDRLFRDLLVDLSGNTHRSELCIDKLADPATPAGRQGLVELRAFEMPPHPRMAVAQMALVRALVACFAQRPYRHPLIRWGTTLHDRFLLPTWLWQDFEDVLAFVRSHGVALPAAAYRPFLDLRCPIAGRVQVGEVLLEVRNALEPWPVLGEQLTAGGTSRFVDSSMERIEVRAVGLPEARYGVLVNGHQLPMRGTGVAGESIGGVRFRAWAPVHGLHPHLGVHHPLRIEVVDRWGGRSLGAGTYHVWHPEGRAFSTPPLTRFEASARRAQRFTRDGQSSSPVRPIHVEPSPESPHTLDLRRLAIDRPLPPPPSESPPAIDTPAQAAEDPRP